MIKYNQTQLTIPFNHANISSELNKFDKDLSTKLLFVTEQDNTVNSIYYKTNDNTLIKLPVATGNTTKLTNDAIHCLDEIIVKIKNLRAARINHLDKVRDIADTAHGNNKIVETYFSKLELYSANAVSVIADVDVTNERVLVKTTAKAETYENREKTTVIEDTVIFVPTCDDREVVLKDSIINAITELRTKENSVYSSHILSYSNDEEEAAMHHLELESIIDNSKQSTELNDFLLNRLPAEQIDTFKAFIWSSYVAKNTSRQLIYVYDPDGNSGKSVFFDTVFKPLADINAKSTITGRDLTGDFGMESCYHSRVLIFADNKNPQIVRSQLVHTITGHDEITVNPKNQRHFTFTPHISIWAHSNILPEIDIDATHERTRIALFYFKLSEDAKKQIYITDENGNLLRDDMGFLRSKGDSKFASKLSSDLPYFLAECKKCYEKLCTTGADIDVVAISNNYSMLTDANEVMIEMNNFIENEVLVDVNANSKDCLTANEFKQIYDAAKEKGILKQTTFAQIKDHLAKLGCIWNCKSNGRRHIKYLVAK